MQLPAAHEHIHWATAKCRLPAFRQTTSETSARDRMQGVRDQSYHHELPGYSICQTPYIVLRVPGRSARRPLLICHIDVGEWSIKSCLQNDCRHDR